MSATDDRDQVAHRPVLPWELLTERPRTDGWLPVTTRTYRMPDGSVSDWDIHTTPFTTVAVLALTDEDDVVLARQFRPGPGAIVLDLPGGIVDPGEDLLTAAVRELREETGFTCESVEVAGSCWAFGASTWRRNVTVARGCRSLGAVASWGGDEYCEPVVVTLADLREIARAGDSTDVDLVYLALDAAGLL
ncbi:MAG TPA: NUDIX hydrolase [Actinomycetes bacterium]